MLASIIELINKQSLLNERNGLIILIISVFLLTFQITSALPLPTAPSVDNGSINKNGNNNNNNNAGSRSSSSVDVLALFSFAVHVLARYPYETDSVVSCGWRFLDVHVPTFASYVVGKYNVK